MELEDLGYTDKIYNSRLEYRLENFDIGRVIAEHKERYVVKTIKGEFNAEITGHLRFTAKNRNGFPAVGDWVALTSNKAGVAKIHRILPRFSSITRKAVGHFGELQIIAANIDYAFLVQAVERDFNINRLERYLTICNSSNVEPIIILTKTDLIDEPKINEIVKSIKSRIDNVTIIPISNQTRQGYDTIYALIKKGKTYCMLGSSGVGKSTLINNLSRKTIMKTDSISLSSNKGKHVTTHRELIILENGGILIDNPGMREVGITDSTGGLETTFDLIVRHSFNCRFKDCTHTRENGCAVLEAVENGEIDKASFENYKKLEREKAHLESSIEEKRKKDRAFGKMLKHHKKTTDRNEEK